jgi:predicted nucleic acid-binding protein
MALIADSGAIYGLHDRRDRHHRALRRVIEQERGPILISQAILSEIDYLLRAKLGSNAELDFLDDIIASIFTLEPFMPIDVIRSRDLVATYRDMDLGLADAAVIATAERLGVNRILTVDERDFRAVRPADGKPFQLLPADA